MDFVLSEFSNSVAQEIGEPDVEKVVVGGEDMKAYVFKDKELMSPGTWNGWYYSPDELHNAYNNTDWTDTTKLSLFADHVDKSTSAWIGYVRNPMMSGDALKGDLVVVDKDYVKKLMFGAKFGISPKLFGKGQNGAVKNCSYENFSVVVNPACKTTFLNSEEEEFENAAWSTAMVNDLPDSSFAYISPGGEKDADGKTEPRSLRHLPYKDAKGKPDASHVRNALARLNQTDIPASAKATALAKLRAAAKTIGVEVTEKLSEEDEMATEKEEVSEKTEAKVEEPQVDKTDELVTKLSDSLNEGFGKLNDGMSDGFKGITEKLEEMSKAEEAPAEPEPEPEPAKEEEKEEPKVEEKEEEKVEQKEVERASVSESDMLPAETKGFANIDRGMASYLKELGDANETMSLELAEAETDAPWMDFTLASTATTVSSTRGSAFNTYRLQPALWAKAIIDGGKNLMFYSNGVRQASVPAGTKDHIMPIRNKYEETWEASSEEYAVDTNVSATVLNDMDGVVFTPTRYTYRAAITQKAINTNAIDLVRYAREEMAYKWANDADAAIATALAAATTSADDTLGAIDLYGGDATSTATLAAGDTLTTDMIAQAATYLEDDYNYFWNAGTFTKDDIKKNPWQNSSDAPFLLYIHPRQKEVLLTDSQFVNASEYGGNEVVLNGEIGQYLGCKVLVSNNTPAATTWGAGNNLAGHTCMLVKSQYCGGMAWGQKPSIKAFDWPISDQKQVILSMEYAAAVLHPDAIIRLRVLDS